MLLIIGKARAVASFACTGAAMVKATALEAVVLYCLPTQEDSNNGSLLLRSKHAATHHGDSLGEHQKFQGSVCRSPSVVSSFRPHPSRDRIYRASPVYTSATSTVVSKLCLVSYFKKCLVDLCSMIDDSSRSGCL